MLRKAVVEVSGIWIQWSRNWDFRFRIEGDSLCLQGLSEQDSLAYAGHSPFFTLDLDNIAESGKRQYERTDVRHAMGLLRHSHDHPQHWQASHLQYTALYGACAVGAGSPFNFRNEPSHFICSWQIRSDAGVFPKFDLSGAWAGQEFVLGVGVRRVAPPSTI